MTRVVQLSDEAYARLRMLKEGSESFSDVVIRLTGKSDLSGLRGLRTRAAIKRAEAQIRSADELDRPEAR